MYLTNIHNLANLILTKLRVTSHNGRFVTACHQASPVELARAALVPARPLRHRQIEAGNEGQIYCAHRVDLVRRAAESRHVAPQQTERLDRVGTTARRVI